MRIKLVSDLHLEFSDINIQNDNNYDVLILSGDIMVAQDLHDHPETKQYIQAEIMDMMGARQKKALQFREFLSRVSFQFPHVVYVAGNHEFYHGKFYASIDHLRAECSKFPNIYFLERDSKVIDDVTFVGGTLWTDMNKGDPLTMHAVKDMMNDFKIIRNDQKGYTAFKPYDAAERFRQTVGYIKTVVETDPLKKYVVVGHHAPSFASISERYKNDSLMNGAYASDLSDFILDHPQIKLWTHGHMHQCFDYMIGSTRIVCNPRGYEGFEPDSFWNQNILLEV
jgi:Icc-related predicted phosphoesterase